MLQGIWDQVGVAVQIQGLDPDTLTSVCCPAFDYDVIIWGWGSDPDPAVPARRGAVQRDPDPASARPATATRSTTSSSSRRRSSSIGTPGSSMIHEMQRIAHRGRRRTSSRTTRAIEAWRTDTFTGWSFEDPTLGHRGPEPARVLPDRPSRPSAHRATARRSPDARERMSRLRAARLPPAKVGWAMVTLAVVITLQLRPLPVLPGDPAKAGVRDPRLNAGVRSQALARALRARQAGPLDLDGGNPLDTQSYGLPRRAGRGATSGPASRSATGRSPTSSGSALGQHALAGAAVAGARRSCSA